MPSKEVTIALRFVFGTSKPAILLLALLAKCGVPARWLIRSVVIEK